MVISGGGITKTVTISQEKGAVPCTAVFSLEIRYPNSEASEIELSAGGVLSNKAEIPYPVSLDLPYTTDDVIFEVSDEEINFLINFYGMYQEDGINYLTFEVSGINTDVSNDNIGEVTPVSMATITPHLQLESFNKVEGLATTRYWCEDGRFVEVGKMVFSVRLMPEWIDLPNNLVNIRAIIEM